jgi:hypothetical protein
MWHHRPEISALQGRESRLIGKVCAAHDIVCATARPQRPHTHVFAADDRLLALKRQADGVIFVGGLILPARLPFNA